MSLLLAALATAESRTRVMVSAAPRSQNWRIEWASSTGLLRIRSRTTRALVADMRALRWTARMPGRSFVLLVSVADGHQRRPFAPRSWPAWNRKVRVGANSPSLWPTIDSVTYTGHVLAAVVDGDGVADHVGDDGRATRPGLDDRLLTLLVEDVHLLEEVVVDEGALLQAAGHLGSPSITGASRGCGGDGRSAAGTACSGCGYGLRACPRAKPDGGRRRSCPRHHRGGGRRGSWPHHGSGGGRPSSGCGRPCRS